MMTFNSPDDLKPVPAFGAALLSAVGFYVSFSWNKYYPPADPTQLTFSFLLSWLCLSALGIALWRLPVSGWLYLMLSFIPLETSVPHWKVPALSPLDYFSAVGLVAWVCRYQIIGGMARLPRLFPKGSFWAWGAFLLFGILDARYSGGSVRGVLRWGEFLFFMALGMQAARESSSDAWAKTAAWLSGLTALVAVCALYQFVDSGGDYKLTVATFGQHNPLGGFLLLGLPSSWTCWRQARRHRGFWLTLFIFNASAFTAAFSRGAWLGLLVGLLAVSLCYGRRQRPPGTNAGLWGTLILLIVAGTCLPLAVGHHFWKMEQHAFSNADLVFTEFHPTKKTLQNRLTALSERPAYWKAADRIFEAHPWIGLGPGNYAGQLPHYLTGIGLHVYKNELFEAKHWIDFWQHLHNIYLQILVEYGFLGYGLWVLSLMLLLRPALRGDSHSAFVIGFQASLIGFLVHNMVDIMFVGSFDLLFAFLVTQCTISNDENPHRA